MLLSLLPFDALNTYVRSRRATCFDLLPFLLLRVTADGLSSYAVTVVPRDTFSFNILVTLSLLALLLP